MRQSSCGIRTWWFSNVSLSFPVVLVCCRAVDLCVYLNGVPQLLYKIGPILFSRSPKKAIQKLPRTSGPLAAQSLGLQIECHSAFKYHCRGRAIIDQPSLVFYRSLRSRTFTNKNIYVFKALPPPSWYTQLNSDYPVTDHFLRDSCKSLWWLFQQMGNLIWCILKEFKTV